MRLADVGAELQEKLHCARARVEGEGVTARVEALYLAGAGVGTVLAPPPAALAARALSSDVCIEMDDAARAPCSVVEDAFRDLDPAAAAVASGALRALRTLRAVLAS
ncbi:MAG: hypothetical protein ABI551_22255 [Polyangiaceae bacterium]